jgi:hypothetical protein
MTSQQPSLIPQRQLLRLIFLTFILGFVGARALAVLMMARILPDIYLHVRGTHIHHLNYGIFLLATVGAYLLLVQPSDRGRRHAAVVYGFGFALTFDEFGMWLHLGGGYWQRATYDAVTVITAVLGLGAFAPPLRSWQGRQLLTAALVLLVGIGFFWMLAWSFEFAERRAGP